MPITSPFSYYGAKGKLADKYLAPQHDLIIEPFAGSACYSFKYWDRQIWINDLDPRTYTLWEFLTSGEAVLPYLELIPQQVTIGQRISEIFDVDTLPPGFVELMRSFCNVGTQGAKSVHDVITKFGAVKWKDIKTNLQSVVPRVKHWKVTNLHYKDLPNPEATWHIDPPYANAAGDRYRQGSSNIDFAHLGRWCQDRNGLVMVCENLGADWLPFQPLTPARMGVQSDYQKSQVGEVVWVKNPASLFG